MIPVADAQASRRAAVRTKSAASAAAAVPAVVAMNLRRVNVFLVIRFLTAFLGPCRQFSLGPPACITPAARAMARLERASSRGPTHGLCRRRSVNACLTNGSHSVGFSIVDSLFGQSIIWEKRKKEPWQDQQDGRPLHDVTPRRAGGPSGATAALVASRLQSAWRAGLRPGGGPEPPDIGEAPEEKRQGSRATLDP